MARLIKLFRYYGENSLKNYPVETDYLNLAAGNIFLKYNPVILLGIQATSGTRFYINNSTSPIVIGDTGIYELDLENLGTISSIRVNREDLAAITENNPIMIDIVYEGASS